MKGRNLIIGIGVLLIILFIVFVFYSKSQWRFVNPNEPIEKTPGQIALEEKLAGQVRFTLLSRNETNRCNNSFDDDNDTFLDCEDSDCFFHEVCLNETI